jgi:hypothetical protein
VGIVGKNKLMEIKCLDTLSPTDRQIVLVKLETLINLDISQGVDKQAVQAATRGLPPKLVQKLMEALKEYCSG